MNASDVWRQSCVPNGRVQFYASVMVLMHLSRYHGFKSHRERVMAILAARQR